jgi:hypothetical protein
MLVPAVALYPRFTVTVVSGTVFTLSGIFLGCFLKLYLNLTVNKTKRNEVLHIVPVVTIKGR